ncbi:MAG: hypothetical protein ACUVRJ_04505, partial [Candidatus Villigracilaceae bacterium]
CGKRALWVEFVVRKAAPSPTNDSASRNDNTLTLFSTAFYKVGFDRKPFAAFGRANFAERKDEISLASS